MVQGQSRAFIHISDTAQCIELAIRNADFEASRPRIFNQVSEVRSVLELAQIIEGMGLKSSLRRIQGRSSQRTSWKFLTRD